MAALLAAASSSCSHTDGGTLPLRRVTDVALPGPASRFDYQDVDTGRRRLFIAHLGASRIDVVDLDSLRVVATIPGVSQVHGVRVAPDLGRLYASATGANEVLTFDEDTLAPLGRAQAGGYPDGIAYVPTAGRVYVSNEVGKSETVLDARSGRLVGTARFEEDDENLMPETASDCLFCKIGAGEIPADVVHASDRVVATTHLAGCEHPHGLYMDSSASAAFVACDGNARLLVVDLKSMGVVSSHKVGSRPDVLAFDAGLRRLYVAAESGQVAVFDARVQWLRLLGLAKLASNAHSVAVDQVSHRAFFPLQTGKSPPVLRVMVGS